MPAWENAITDEQIRKIAAFLTRIKNLPAPVWEFWENLYGVSPDSYKPEQPMELRGNDEGIGANQR